MKMKRLCCALVAGVLVAAPGCEEEATDVEPVAPTVPEEEPATSGYRGLEDQTAEPDAEPGVVDPQPDATLQLEDRTPQPTFDEPGTPADPQQQATPPAADQQPTPDGTEPLEQDPVVEEEPAETLPPEGNTGEGQQGQGGS